MLGRVSVFIWLLFLTGCNQTPVTKPQTKQQPEIAEPPQPDFTKDRSVYVEARNMDGASKVDFEPVFVNLVNEDLAGLSGCSNIFVTKNKSLADYEIRFDYYLLDRRGKMRVFLRITSLWDKSETVVNTLNESGDTTIIKKVVSKAVTDVCSRISLFKIGQSGAAKP